MSFKDFATSTVLIGVMLVSSAQSVQATSLQLSEYSSEDIPYTEAEYLRADLDFVVDVINARLSLTVTNNTFDDSPSTNQTAFDIRELYFNVNEDTVTNLTLFKVWAWDDTGTIINGSHDSEWDNNTVVDFDNKANGFGMFDVLVKGDDNSVVIAPGYKFEFIFDIAGTGPFSNADFTTYLSAQFNHNILGLAAAEFANGGSSGNDSAYGMVTPEPATICLLGIGIGGLVLLRKRRV